MPRPRACRNLVLTVATAALVLTGAPDVPAQGPKPPASQTSPKSSEPVPARSTSRLEKLAADSAQALEKYRAALEPVLEIYERELVRQTELAQISQDLFERGALSADELQQSRRAFAAAQKNVADTRRDRAEADRMLTEARIAEVARLRPLKLGGYEETAGLIRFNGPAKWSLAGDTLKLQRFFASQFGRALPISAFRSLMKSQASRVKSVRGTTSSAEKHDAKPMLSVPWPVKYQWWPVPMIPPVR